MSTVTTKPATSTYNWRFIASIVGGGIILAVGILFILTAITAYVTRLRLQEHLSPLQSKGQFEIKKLDGGPYWSQIKLHFVRSDIYLNATLQHFGLNSNIIGTIEPTNQIKISQPNLGTNSGKPLATLTGYIHSHLWNNNISGKLIANGNPYTVPTSHNTTWQLATWKAQLIGTNQTTKLELQLPNIALLTANRKTANLQDLKISLNRHLLDTEPHEQLDLKFTLATGFGQLLTGMLKSGGIDLKLGVVKQEQAQSFDLQINAKNLNHQGLPLIQLTSFKHQTIGTFHTPKHEMAWWDANLQLDTASNYGPIQAKVNIVGPNNIKMLMRQSGRIRIQASVPMALWQIFQMWQEESAQVLIANGIAKPQGTSIVFNTLLRNGTWHVPKTSTPNNPP